MGHDVTQWLTEIRTLQRQLADALKERDQAYNSAANWRRLYETEARQRRQTVLGNQQSQPAVTPPGTETNSPDSTQPEAAATAASHLQPGTPADDSPQAQLHHLRVRCQILEQQLAEERAAHARTRQTLTTALGETFASLKPDLSQREQKL